MQPAILELGRGPTIAGSRITVYDVLAESAAGATPEEMAGWWQLEVEQILCAQRYIEEHCEQVDRGWAEIKARHARGHPPHVQKIVDEIHARMAPLWEEWHKGNKEPMLTYLAEKRRTQQENSNGSAAGGHQRAGSSRDAAVDAAQSAVE